MGLSAVESAKFGKAAGDLYAGAYGDSLDQVNEAIKLVVQNVGGMRNASTADLKQVSAGVLNVASTFGQDLGGVTNAVSQLMRTGLAKNATDALNIVTAGFQAGNDKGGDLLDTINEYGTQFRKVGIDGKTAMGLIQQGLQAGARDSDIVADAIKEFSIRAVDGSKTTIEAFQALGLNAVKFGGQIAKGGPAAKAGLQTVLDKLRAIKDPMAQARLATALFGTQAEDLGKALFALDPSKAAAGLGDISNAAKSIDVMSTADQLEVVKRQLTGVAASVVSTFLPALGAATGFLSSHATVVKVAAGAVAGLFAAYKGYKAVNAAVDATKQAVKWWRASNAQLVLHGIRITVANTATKIWTATTTVAGKATKLFAGAMKLLGKAFLGNPIGLAVTGLVLLGVALFTAWKKSETFRQVVISVFNAVKGAVTTALNIAKNVVTTVFGVIKAVITTTLNVVKAVVTTVWNAVSATFRTVLGAISTVVTTYFNIYKAVITAVLNVIKAVISAVWNGIVAVFRTVLGVISTTVSFYFNLIKTVVTTVINGVLAVVRAVWGAIQAATSAVWNTIRSIVSGAINGVLAVVSSVGGAIRNAFVGAWNAIVGGVSAAWNTVRSLVSQGVSSVIGIISGLPGAIAGAAGRVLSAAASVGSAVMNGIANGLRTAVSFVGDLIGSVKNAINSALHLPLRVDIDAKLFSIHQTIIPALAGGGLTTGVTLAQVGDNPSGNEAILPMDSPRTVAMFASAFSQAFGNTPAAASPSLSGTRLKLVVGGREFDAYLDDRVAGGLDGLASAAGYRAS